MNFTTRSFEKFSALQISSVHTIHLKLTIFNVTVFPADTLASLHPTAFYPSSAQIVPEAIKYFTNNYSFFMCENFQIYGNNFTTVLQ